MNFALKLRIKTFWKKRWPIIVGSGSFLLIAGIILLVGFGLSGWSIVRWLQSGYAVTFFVLLFLGVFLAGWALFQWFRFKILEEIK